MKIYVTNAALGYNQYAYLVKLDKSEHGHNYLCIGFDGHDQKDTQYIDGGIVLDLEDIYVIESTYNINDSPLKGSFLFEFFLKNYADGN